MKLLESRSGKMQKPNLRFQVVLLSWMAVSQCWGFSVVNFQQSATTRSLSVVQKIPTRTTSIHLSAHRLFMASSLLENNSGDDNTPTAMSASNADNQDDNQNEKTKIQALRSYLRQVTGFSFTAFRATMRAATGISLTAVYASTLAATSAFVRKVMAVILSPLPPWFRYFLQPLLILYYAPLFILRNLAGPTRKEAREAHEVFVDSFKAAVDAADKKADGYWPNEEGVKPPQQSAKKKKREEEE